MVINKYNTIPFRVQMELDILLVKYLGVYEYVENRNRRITVQSERLAALLISSLQPHIFHRIYAAQESYKKLYNRFYSLTRIHFCR